MFNMLKVSQLLLIPAAFVAAVPTSPTTPLKLEKRSTCGVEATVTYYKSDSCGSNNAIANINWKNNWSSYNYQLSNARSFAITNGDYWDIYCGLYDGYNGQGNRIATLEWNTGYNCKSLGVAGANVKSIVCWGNNC
ncbi:uncharacterized protein N7529_001459 [Penicillium soppii]|jgi:hypothetical protein|uniref:uncharacterized protein n=1 Tax=Penicillium soppii TaxID=69789 RepID=UPI0025481D85|nr:uncharacterized protein N7529_001459 [Penicillium soppii]KAJ5875875.1 hypothetical protein N7529_001459 [Penicillium soppii]